MLKIGNIEEANENREIFKNPDNFIFDSTSDNVHNLCSPTADSVNFRICIWENLR